MAPVTIPALERFIDFRQPSLYLSLFAIAFNPTFWNIAAQREYHHKSLTRLFGGNRKVGCYALALSIFTLGLLRDSLFKNALRYQPRNTLLAYGEFKAAAAVLFLAGMTLVVTSTWKLGITGTFLGDYFGILMDAKVESFPFNVCNNPMYVGSTLSFLATSLWYESPAGLLLTVVVHVVYRIALRFEEPFTNAIYQAREQQRQASGEKKEL